MEAYGESGKARDRRRTCKWQGLNTTVWSLASRPAAAGRRRRPSQRKPSDSTQVVPQITTKQLLARMQSYAEAQFADPARNKQELIVPLQRFLRLAYELSVPDAERSDAALAAFPESARGQELRKLYRGIVKAEFGYECLLNTESVSSRFMRISPALEALRRCNSGNGQKRSGHSSDVPGFGSAARRGGALARSSKLLPRLSSGSIAFTRS